MTGNKQRSQVVADIGKNRLLILVRGHVCKEDLESIYTDIRFGVADLAPGFSVITDMTEGKIGHLSGVLTFKKIADFLGAKGVGTVVRVVGRPSIISKQIARLAAMIQGYHPIHVATMQEAEELLEPSETKAAAAQ